MISDPWLVLWFGFGPWALVPIPCLEIRLPLTAPNLWLVPATLLVLSPGSTQ